ncbi:MAG: YihY/virulence factor BrkB family protein [Pyrinomonadaceae bacterium]|nr:YihY/virulence factor BrkB family protein [Pyrinomonadaceae bacterium]
MNTQDQKDRASIWKLGGLTWRELGRRIWLEIYESDLFTRAAALSYYFLLALFPLLLFLTALLGYFAKAGTELRKNLLSYLGRVVPRSASELIDTTINEISNDAGGGKLSFGLLAALWFASYGMGAVSETLNAAYGVKETRPWWRVRLSAVGLTIVLAVLVISALALVLYGREIGDGVANRFGLGAAFTLVWNVLQWPIVMAFVLFAFALIYYFAPDLYHRKWYWITPGSVTGVALWLLVSVCFRVYLRYFDRYSVTYGSLGAVIILMLWFYLTGAAILVGGKVNAEIEHAAATGAPGAKLHGEKSPS